MGQIFSSDDQPLLNNFYLIDTSIAGHQWEQSTAFRNGLIYTVWNDGHRVMGMTFDVKNLFLGVDDRRASTIPTFELSQNFPNPFNPSTKIRFTLSHREHVSLSVFDILGRKTAVLVDQVLENGSHEFEWDGTNNSGNAVASGIYIFRLENASGTILQKKAILLR
jgi:hypothetical protein